MLSTRRDDHEVSSLDVLVFASNGRFAHTRGESQGLVDGVNLRDNSIQSIST